MLKTCQAAAVRDGASYDFYSNVGSKIFAYSFERVFLPAARALVPPDRLPYDWHETGSLDSFKTNKRAAEHYRNCHNLNTLSFTSQPCIHCIENLVGFRPVFDWKPVSIEIARGVVALLIQSIVVVWKLFGTFAVFSVAIWLVPPTLTPQQRRRLEADKRRKEKEDEELEKEARARAEAQRDKNNRYASDLNKGDTHFSHSADAEVDDKRVGEANHYGDRAKHAKTAEEADDYLRRQENAMHKTERFRERHADDDDDDKGSYRKKKS